MEDETAGKIRRILETYDCDSELVESQSCHDGGLGPLFLRLDRAATDQMCDDESTLSRYAIWANTVHDYIVHAIKLRDEGDARESRRHLIGAANAMAAFSEIQDVLGEAGAKGKVKRGKKAKGSPTETA